MVFNLFDLELHNCSASCHVGFFHRALRLLLSGIPDVQTVESQHLNNCSLTTAIQSSLINTEDGSRASQLSTKKMSQPIYWIELDNCIQAWRWVGFWFSWWLCDFGWVFFLRFTVKDWYILSKWKTFQLCSSKDLSSMEKLQLVWQEISLPF